MRNGCHFVVFRFALWCVKVEVSSFIKKLGLKPINSAYMLFCVVEKRLIASFQITRWCWRAVKTRSPKWEMSNFYRQCMISRKAYFRFFSFVVIKLLIVSSRFYCKFSHFSDRSQFVYGSLLYYLFAVAFSNRRIFFSFFSKCNSLNFVAVQPLATSCHSFHLEKHRRAKTFILCWVISTQHWLFSSCSVF